MFVRTSPTALVPPRKSWWEESPVESLRLAKFGALGPSMTWSLASSASSAQRAFAAAVGQWYVLVPFERHWEKAIFLDIFFSGSKWREWTRYDQTLWRSICDPHRLCICRFWTSTNPAVTIRHSKNSEFWSGRRSATQGWSWRLCFGEGRGRCYWGILGLVGIHRDTMRNFGSCEFTALQRPFLCTSCCWTPDDFLNSIWFARNSCFRIFRAFRQVRHLLISALPQKESEIEAWLLCKGPGTKLVDSKWRLCIEAVVACKWSDNSP